MTETINGVPLELLKRAVQIPSKASVEENHAAIVDRGRAQAELRDMLYAAPVSEAKAQGVVMPAELDRAFITGESCDGVYRVVIQSEKLKEMQAVHSWLTSLNAAHVQHPDDDAVDRFAVAMKVKLAASRKKGRHGWQNATGPHLSSLLHEHMFKGDPLDVGNLAMMLHQNGQAIELPHDARRVTAPVQQVSVPDVLREAIKWADHLCFECGALVQTRAPSVHVYNKTFEAVQAAKALLAAAPAAPAADAGLVEALEMIVNPIEAMRRELQEGEQLNGMVAMQLASDPEYLRGVAKAALAAHRAKGVV